MLIILSKMKPDLKQTSVSDTKSESVYTKHTTKPNTESPLTEQHVPATTTTIESNTTTKTPTSK